MMVNENMEAVPCWAVRALSSDSTQVAHIYGAYKFEKFVSFQARRELQSEKTLTYTT